MTLGRDEVSASGPEPRLFQSIAAHYERFRLGFPDRLLHRSAGGRERWTWGDLILGITLHDAYHAGQIQMLKRLWSSR